MTQAKLANRYFEWMYHLVVDERYFKQSYRKLFEMLNEVEFTYTIPMDGNRAEDGIDLRYRFGREHGYDDSMISTYLDIYPCSVLEMMVALAIRCEEHIMDDPDVGDRTGQWFWSMLVSLGLGSETDSRIDICYVSDRIRAFLNHEYAADGKGGLFTIENPDRDMSGIEIWCQMNYYLNEIIQEGGL